MKTILSLIITLGILLSSCKKEYTCKCTTYGIEVLEGEIKSINRKANEYCDDLEMTISGKECEPVLID